jgi:DNA excision repair protein ERCC-4
MKKILDIFQKPKTKTQDKQTITIDHREKNSLVPSILSREFKLIFKQLPVADYLINSIAIERKTIQDLKSSIINKRIFTQLQEIKQYPNHLLIIEGSPDELKSSISLHENAVRGFLLSLALDRVPIIFSENEKETATFISLLAKKKQKQISIRPSKQTKNKKELQQFILEGFPNLGPKKAKLLLEKFSSLNKIFLASPEELQPILGKRTKDFLDIIN